MDDVLNTSHVSSDEEDIIVETLICHEQATEYLSERANMGCGCRGQGCGCNQDYGCCGNIIAGC